MLHHPTPEDHDAQWARINLHDRISQTLSMKLEGDNGRMPERGMFNCADIAALLAECTTHDQHATTNTQPVKIVRRRIDLAAELLNLENIDG